MTPDLTCPECGEGLPADAPRGLCPACLLQAGLASDMSEAPDPQGAHAGAYPLGMPEQGIAWREATGGPGPHDVTVTSAPAASGDQETLAEELGGPPRVRLRDTEPEDDPGTVEMPDWSHNAGAGKYRLLGEIARGGMGAVHRARDADLGRELAIKVLLESQKGRPELVRRFLEEAQIGGQLQHPGIVPVYDLGTLDDRRPFFAMKLVRGRTLAALLAGRPDPAHDLPRMLAIFEQVAQTVAYAHARGVIHRDLKPANVMVGGFGEVQVMDWGLAKVLPRVDADAGRDRPEEPESAIQTARDGSGADASVAGTVMGTPAYMAPEQARGEVEGLDERADVFALGSILCEILTGRPAFVGPNGSEVLRKAKSSDLADAVDRLDACGADVELATLSRHCLAAVPRSRPRDAGAVVARVTAHLAGVQERLRAAELERARAEARAVEERKRRRVGLALAASVLALVVLGGGGVAWNARRIQREATRVALLFREAELLGDQARARPDDPGGWSEALEAIRRVEVARGDAADPETRTSLETLKGKVLAGRDAARSDRDLVERLGDIRDARADDPDGAITDAAYADAFRSAGFDLDAFEAGGHVRRRPPAVATAMVAALDDWTAVSRGRDREGPGWRRLVGVARDADPHPDRDQLRAALLLDDDARRLELLRPLAARADVAGWEPASLVLLGNILAGEGDLAAGEAVLNRAVVAHPSDVWVHYSLGRLLERTRPPRAEEAIRSYTTARALRPETAHVLAHALDGRGRGEEAEAVFRDLIRRRPANGGHLGCYANLLKKRGRIEEATAVRDRAIVAHREAIRLNPDDAGEHMGLGNALSAGGNHDRAIAALREAVRLKPGLARVHTNLGFALSRRGKHDEAISAHREAIRLKPDSAEAHHGLGFALSDGGDRDGATEAHREAVRLKPHDAVAHGLLGLALFKRGKHDEAIAEYREAIRLRPDHGEGYRGLGIVLGSLGKSDEAIPALREAIRLRPDDAEAHGCLGMALWDKGDRDGATAAFREAIRLKPDHATAHCGLAKSLMAQGKPDEAIAEFREAIRLKSDYVSAYGNLGYLLSSRGDHAGAIAAFRELIRLKPDDAEAHYQLGLALWSRGYCDGAIAAYHEAIRLRAKNAVAHYSLGIALWCQGKEQDAIAAYRESIRLGPDFADAHCNLSQALLKVGRYSEAVDEAARGHELGSRQPGWAHPSARWVRDAEQRRYDAARAAALAGCGRGNDKPAPNDVARAVLRKQALDWLGDDLTLRTKQLDGGTAETRLEIQILMDSWKREPDLAGVRDPKALAALPGPERARWQEFWVKVEQIRERAGRPAPNAKRP